jgi:hypothetical protein
MVWEINGDMERNVPKFTNKVSSIMTLPLQIYGFFIRQTTLKQTHSSLPLNPVHVHGGRTFCGE